MVRRKNIRERGKLRFSRAFQSLNENDSVSVVIERAKQPSFPSQIQGRTGIVESKRGRCYVIKIKDLNKEKRYIINPIHLKKIKKISKK